MLSYIVNDTFCGTPEEVSAYTNGRISIDEINKMQPGDVIIDGLKDGWHLTAYTIACED